MTSRLLMITMLMMVATGCAPKSPPPREPVVPSLAEVPASAPLIGSFGIVTDPERLTVNGLEIAFDDRVVQPTAPTTGQELPLSAGSTIFVEAYQIAPGFRARRIEPFFPIVGAVDHIQRRQGRLDIMGTTVRMPEGTKVTDRRAGRSERSLGIKDIAAAHRVAVSGLWQDNEIVASRIDILERTGPAFIGGLLRPGDDRITVAGTLLDYACCRHLRAPVFARLKGRYQDDYLAVTSLSTGRGLLFSDEVERLIIEATPARQEGIDGVHLSGLGIRVAPSSRIAIETGASALFIGRYGDSFAVEQRVALPTNEAERTQALERIVP